MLPKCSLNVSNCNRRTSSLRPAEITCGHARIVSPSTCAAASCSGSSSSRDLRVPMNRRSWRAPRSTSAAIAVAWSAPMYTRRYEPGVAARWKSSTMSPTISRTASTGAEAANTKVPSSSGSAVSGPCSAAYPSTPPDSPRRTTAEPGNAPSSCSAMSRESAANFRPPRPFVVAWKSAMWGWSWAVACRTVHVPANVFWVTVMVSRPVRP